MDRGFAAYELWAEFVAQRRQFVCRCPRSHFSANQLFADDQAGRSVGGHAEPSPKSRRPSATRACPATLTLRLVTVRLATGELEVLAATSWTKRFSHGGPGNSCHHRWGIETYYGLVKGRLDLENFSGLSAEAVRQDVQATVFINVGSPDPARPGGVWQPPEPRRHPAQVNRAVSFSCARKPHHPTAAEPGADGPGLAQTHRLFLDNPVSHRPKPAAARENDPAGAPTTQHGNKKKRLLNRNSLTGIAVQRAVPTGDD